MRLRAHDQWSLIADCGAALSVFGSWSKDENQHVIQIIHVQLSKHLQSHLNMISHFLMTSIAAWKLKNSYFPLACHTVLLLDALCWWVQTWSWWRVGVLCDTFIAKVLRCTVNARLIKTFLPIMRSSIKQQMLSLTHKLGQLYGHFHISRVSRKTRKIYHKTDPPWIILHIHLWPKEL